MNNTRYVQDDIDEWKKTYLEQFQCGCKDCENGVIFVSSQTKVDFDTDEYNKKTFFQIKTVELCVTCEVHARTFIVAQECFTSNDGTFYSYKNDWTCQDDLTQVLRCGGYKKTRCEK